MNWRQATDKEWMRHLKKRFAKRRAADKMARQTRKEQRRAKR